MKMNDVRQPNPDSSRDLTRGLSTWLFWSLPIVRFDALSARAKAKRLPRK
jgi:hypothetical protein